MKRQKIDTEPGRGRIHATSKNSGSEIANGTPLPDTVSPSSPNEPLRERYLQTYFKPKVNAVLQDHRKSRILKDMPNWSRIARRLKGVSVNMISTLRRDYHEGWKTWDGSAFTELAKPLQNNTVSADIKAEPASPTLVPAVATPSSPVAAKPQIKLNIAHKAKANAKPKARKTKPTEDYNPEDGEYTASKTVSTMSFLPFLPSFPTFYRFVFPPCQALGCRPSPGCRT